MWNNAGMSTFLPSVEEVRAGLQRLNRGDIYRVAEASGVPSSTLWKIRCGVTPNPGIETVRKFFHLLPAVDTAATQREAA